MGDVEPTRWDRLMCSNRLTLWAGSWVTYLWHRRVLGVYDDLMIKLWPYDRWPEEWRSVLRRK